jgi:hypothetical protein
MEKDLRVAWFTLETLTAAIGRAKADGSVARTVTRICQTAQPDFLMTVDMATPAQVSGGPRRHARHDSTGGPAPPTTAM